MGKGNRHANRNVLYMVLDFLFCFLAYVLAVLTCDGTFQIWQNDFFKLCLCSILLVMMFNLIKKLYDTTLFFYVDRILSYLSQSFLFSNLMVYLLAYVVGHTHIPFWKYACFMAYEFVMLVLSAFFMRWLIRRTQLFAARCVFVGNKDTYSKMIHFLGRNSMGVKLVGYVSEHAYYPEGDGTDYIGTIDELDKVLHDHAVDQVFFFQDDKHPLNYYEYVVQCLEMGVTARIVEPPYNVEQAKNYVSSIGTYPVVTYHNVVMNVYAKALKRVGDILASTIGIIVSAIPMLIISIAIKLDSPGPVLFRQERVGMNGRRFKMLKFRSMCIDAEEKKKELEDKNQMNNNLMFKIEDDPRITRVGRVIRKYSLDELPQFFNVFIGEMSMVGTRPPTLEEVAQYDITHWRRLSIKPGITGMWQTSGRSKITDFEKVVALDKEYIDNWSVWLDFKLLVKTVIQLLFNRGDAY